MNYHCKKNVKPVKKGKNKIFVFSVKEHIVAAAPTKTNSI